MTAIIVTKAALAAAEAVVGGPEFSVPLSQTGEGPETHLGCNWVNCLEDLLFYLAEIEGVALGEGFYELAEALGLQPVEEILP